MIILGRRVIFPWTRGNRGGLPWLALSAVVIALDQASKFWVRSNVALYWERIELLPFLNLVHFRNEGAAFSFLADAGGWQVVFLIVLGLAVSAVLIRWLRKMPEGEQQLLAAALALIVGGALGNVLDRAALGAVTDFVDLHAAGYHFPAFNVADSAISVGAALLIVDSIREWLRERREA